MFSEMLAVTTEMLHNISLSWTRLSYQSRCVFRELTISLQVAGRTSDRKGHGDKLYYNGEDDLHHLNVTLDVDEFSHHSGIRALAIDA